MLKLLFLPGETGFCEFFHQATGYQPFPYQRRMALAETFPSVLNVPTGAGKTAGAILSWLWRRRFASNEVRSQTPRRLVYCLPMRVLVEQTCDNARHWMDKLGLLAAGPGDNRPAADGEARVAVSLLMGGESSGGRDSSGQDWGDWDAYPERDAILIGTQDMLLSRALNRGYGMSRYRWPVHFALLNNDCLWVIDEVQLMGAGLPTTAQLQAFRTSPELGGGGFAAYGPVQSLWMSATLKIDRLKTVDFAAQFETLNDKVVTLEDDDRAHDQLSVRLNAGKPLTKATTVLDKTAEKNGYARDLAQEVIDRHLPGFLTLVVLNRVKRAQDVFRALTDLTEGRARKRAQGKGSPPDPPVAPDKIPELLLIHSRFRPAERKALQERLQAVDRTPPPGGCIVVATQAIEAGVDVSARLLVTELAPWTSLVQRFGRCNRRGEWAGGSPAQVFWVDIAGAEDSSELALPYQAADLARARETLKSLVEVSPRFIAGIKDPSLAPLTHILRRRDLLDLFDTTPDLSGFDLDVSRYIRDAKDNDLHVYWREWDGGHPPDNPLPPRREELCSVSLASARDFIKRVSSQDASVFRWDGLDRRWTRVRDQDLIWPGLTLLVRGDQDGYDRNLGWTGTPGKVPVVHAGQETGEKQDHSMDGDPASIARRFVHLAEHSEAVVQAMESLLSSLGSWPGLPRDELRLAARWHDAGKSHPAFQNMLLDGRDPDDPRRQNGPWAKSDAVRQGARYLVDGDHDKINERKHFRHELAGALALLQGGGSDLAAYLVAAHHGKVRMSIRSLPGETVPPGGRRFARGVWDGDQLPSLDLGAGVRLPPTSLRLDLMELGEGANGPSWLERALTLRHRYGPFRLAWLEALLRVADWRGSLEVSDYA
jgi:CRISPR-associated endonuclease/helicase Cas3